MFGIIGTIGVICQMAMLSLGFDTKIALLFGLVACAAWLGHSMINKDRSLFVTNVVVAGFAVFGLVN
jgi:uncharacterized membrane protein (DUF4010 family)